jgi:hypothetical protein
MIAGRCAAKVAAQSVLVMRSALSSVRVRTATMCGLSEGDTERSIARGALKVDTC